MVRKREHTSATPLRSTTLTRDQTPTWLWENEYIISGYRPPGLSWLEITSSLFSWHNETLNVWSHLIGALLWIHVAWRDSHAFSHSWTSLESFCFAVFYFVSIFCHVASTVFHLFHCRSASCCVSLLYTDYVGISLLVAGHFYPPVLYAFYCHPPWGSVYIFAITFLGTAMIVTTYFPELSMPRWRWLRIALYAGLAGFGVIPAIHATILNPAPVEYKLDLVGRVVIMYLMYATGAFLYTTKIPESLVKRFPQLRGRFDLLFHSHQFWHVIVTVTTFYHYGTALAMMDRAHSLRGDDGTCPSPKDQVLILQQYIPVSLWAMRPLWIRRFIP